MSETELLSRITVIPAVLMGTPVIRGLRISVGHSIRSLAAEISTEDILEEYPDLEQEDIQACLIYAAHLIEEERVYSIAKQRLNDG